MSTLLFVLLPLLLLGAALRGLRHGLYALHVAVVAALAWAARDAYAGLPPFSEAFALRTLGLHLAAINGVTFLAYFLDKRAARRGTRRAPDRTLHALALIGGTPSAWLASRVFRHKTKKNSFRATFWLIAALQIAALTALYASLP